ncbi:MAG TPA: D-alanyl-D-alanine carboxypeptidase family protein [Candidatus Dormibacteraeota bacterium]
MVLLAATGFALTLGVIAGHPRHLVGSAAGRVAAAAPPAAVAPYYGGFAPALGPELGVAAKAGILVDLDAKRVLWARDAGTRRAPASLAKMMTAMVAVDIAGLDRELTVPEAATGVVPNLMGLRPGDLVSVREILYGLFLDSGNDAAETLGQAILPRARFIEAMNARAAAWGLRDTSFSNPSGLDEAGLLTTPYDLAVIAGHLATGYPALMQIAGTKSQWIPATDAHHAYSPYNLNKLLWTYPGATGLKTGLTDDAGGCVVATATRNGRHLLAVVMHSDVFFTDAARLLDYGFATP